MKYEKISGFTDEISSDLEKQVSTARELGLTYIAVRNINGRNICEYLPEEVEGRILPVLNQNNMRVSSIGSPLGKIRAADDEAFRGQLRMAEQAARIARILQCKYIRIFSFYIPEGDIPEKWGDVVAKKIKGYVDIFEGYGITALHENEKEIYGDSAERCAELFKRVNSKYFRGIFDFANFVQCRQRPGDAYEILKNDVDYFHIKDASYKSGETEICGRGDGEIEKILQIAFRHGFDGFLTLEPHLVVFDGLASLERREVSEIIRKNKAENGEEAFRAQYRALDTILKRIKTQEA